MNVLLGLLHWKSIYCLQDEEEPQSEHERQTGIAVPQATYAHLLDPHLQHHQHSLVQYHHNAYYQHLAAAQFHQGHMHEGHVSAAYLAPVTSQLLHSYGMGVEVSCTAPDVVPHTIPSQAKCPQLSIAAMM